MFAKFKEKFNELIKGDKKKLLIIGAVILVVLVGVILICTKGRDFISVVRNPDGEKFKSEYEELNDKTNADGKKYPEVNIPLNNNIKYTDADSVLKIFSTGGDAVVYFGYSSCVYCRNAIQVLVDTAKETELDAIYYLDIEKKSDKYNELMKVLGDELIDSSTEDKKIYSPLVIFITDGKVVSYNKGTLFSQEDPYQKMDASQIEGLSEIYRYGINDVVNSMKLKKNNGANNENSQFMYIKEKLCEVSLLGVESSFYYQSDVINGTNLYRDWFTN